MTLLTALLNLKARPAYLASQFLKFYFNDFSKSALTVSSSA